MAITTAQIDLWRSVVSEHQRLEFKAARNQFEWDNLCEYCVALANEGGGHLLLGVANAPPRPVVGSTTYPNPVKTAEQLFQKVGFRVEVEAIDHPDGRVVVFTVPSRPRGTAYHLDGKYLMRSGESLVPMSEDRLRAIFAEGQPDWGEQIAMAGLSGESVVELLDIEVFFELLKAPMPVTTDGVLDRLEHERLIDRDDARWSIRRLGALLLARRLADFPIEVSRKAPRVVVYNGNSKTQTRLDQIGIRGYAVGFRGLIEFVMAQLPRNEVIRDALRVQVKLVPEIAIRELVANALIHQDLNVGGTSVSIDIYENRIEVSNPGEPVVPVERFIDGYQSRNERMADLMRRMRICEERSSGIDKVVETAEAFQLPAPVFRAGFRRTEVVVYGHRSFEDMDRADRIRACYQHCVLRYVMREYMTNQSLRERFRLSEEKGATVSQIISATIEEGLVKLDASVGTSRRLARYLPNWA